MPDEWYRGLRFWKEANYWKAIPEFSKIAANENLSDWQRSAGAYWSYRAHEKTGNSYEANRKLTLAASFPETFYGMLALAQCHESLRVSKTMPFAPESLWADAAVKRAQMLVALDRNDDAEAELRQRYSTLDAAARPALVTIAAKLNLPNLQLRFAQALHMEDMATRYPMPQLMVEAQTAVDPALILAVARHESGFRETAHNPSGASGMMQILPSTARKIVEQSHDISLQLADNGNDGVASMHDRLNDMTMSAKLGAEYFTMLGKQPAVGNNVMRLLAAYNAGPGTVANWQKTAKNMDDPLLYMESIPYPETHNYVMQVMAHYWTYQALMGEKQTSLQQLAHGVWPTV